MATPNAMPKKPNQIRHQVLSSLIETQPAVWNRKVLKKDKDGKEVVETIKVEQRQLRSSLAQNMTDRNVDILADRWL